MGARVCHRLAGRAEALRSGRETWPSEASKGKRKKGGRRKERKREEKGKDKTHPEVTLWVNFKPPSQCHAQNRKPPALLCTPRRPAPLEPERGSLQEAPVRGALAGLVGTSPAW